MLAIAASLVLCAMPQEGPLARVAHNINTDEQSGASGAGPLIPTRKGGAFFVTDTKRYGAEVWFTDMKKSWLLRDIDRGVHGSFPFVLGVLQNGPSDTAVFLASDDKIGRGLYASDGTVASTKRIANIRLSWRMFSGFAHARLGERFILNIAPTEAKPQNSLWVTDGTAAGTRCLCTFANAETPAYLVVGPRGRFVYFLGWDKTRGRELWRTDGSPSGTKPVFDAAPWPEGSVVWPQASTDNALLLAVRAPGMPQQLWRSDGTPKGTRFVSDLGLLEKGSFYLVQQRMGRKRLAFVCGSERGDGLWLTDGTDAGTHHLLSAIKSSTQWTVFGKSIAYMKTVGIEHQLRSWSPDKGDVLIRVLTRTPLSVQNSLQTLGDKLYIQLHRWPSEGSLYVSDGSRHGTIALVPRQMPFGLSQLPDGRVAFATVNPATKLTSYWSTRGTPASTKHALDIGGRDAGADPTFLTAREGDRVYCRAQVGESASSHSQLWSFDTRSAARIRSPGASFEQLHGVATSSHGGIEKTFLATHEANGSELWLHENGKSARLIQRFANAPRKSTIEAMTVWAGRCFFTVDDGTTGRELWVSDGTTLGTRLLADIATGTASSDPAMLTASANGVFFTAESPARGRELYCSDGTPTGTRIVRELGQGNRGAEIRGIVAARGPRGQPWAYFTRSGLDKPGLWRSDGTRNGTQRITDDSIDDAGEIVATFDRIYCALSTPRHGMELWTSDGSRAGTRLIYDLTPRSTGANPKQLRASDRFCHYTTRAHNGDIDLWMANEVPWRTKILGRYVEIDPRTVSCGDRFYFVARHRRSTAGREIFVANAWGYMKRVRYARRWDRAQAPRDLCVGLGRVWFTAEAKGIGREIWSIDAPGAHARALDDPFPAPDLQMTAPGIGYTVHVSVEGVPADAYGVTMVGQASKPYSVAPQSVAWILPPARAATILIGITRAPRAQHEFRLPWGFQDIRGLHLHAQTWCFALNPLRIVRTSRALSVRIE